MRLRTIERTLSDCYRQMCAGSNPNTVKIIDRWSTETLERKDGLNWDLANVSRLNRASVRTCELALVNVSLGNSDPLILPFRAEAHLNQHHAIVNIVKPTFGIFGIWISFKYSKDLMVYRMFYCKLTNIPLS